MDQVELLQLLTVALERHGIPYIVTGSMATIFFGEPRYTHDIDVVVELPAASVGALLGEFPSPDFYVSEEAALEAVRRRRQFNIIHPRSGLKIDMIVSPGSEFDRSRFARRRRVDAGGFEASFSSPEDTIVKKLDFYRQGGSDKHLRDITGVLLVQGDKLDRDYVSDWAERLGVADLWQLVLDALSKRSEP